MFLEWCGWWVELLFWGWLYYCEVVKGFQQFFYVVNVLMCVCNESGIVFSVLFLVVSCWVSCKIFDWQLFCLGLNVCIFGQEQEFCFGVEEVDFCIIYGWCFYVYEYVVVLFIDWVVLVCLFVFIVNGVLCCLQDIFIFFLFNVEWEVDYKVLL